MPYQMTESIKAIDKRHMYSKHEELYNSLTHLLGLLLSIVALILLIVKAATYGSGITVLAVTIYGVTLCMMYGGSALYHGVSHMRIKRHLRTFDHLNIYFLIAGTYTPVALIGLNNAIGWIIFGLLWGVTIIGILYKTLFFGDSWVSTILYVIMGWTALGFIVQIVQALPDVCLLWIILGGIFYTNGVIFYMMDEKVEGCHVTWHLFVLVGSICHFFAIYFYLAALKV
ncbi:MAG: PAQR family membrane homeostasis protein TrhA [Francisellaceae bacterium]